MVYRRNIGEFWVRGGVVRKVFGERVVILLSRVEIKDGKDYGWDNYFYRFEYYRGNISGDNSIREFCYVIC